MGFFSKFGRPADSGGFNVTTRTTVKQNFRIKVPKDRAEPMQRALEGWVESKGWATLVNASADGGDYVELTFEHDESMPGKPPADLTSSDTLEELQKVIEGAAKPPE